MWNCVSRFTNMVSFIENLFIVFHSLELATQTCISNLFVIVHWFLCLVVPDKLGFNSSLLYDNQVVDSSYFVSWIAFRFNYFVFALCSQSQNEGECLAALEHLMDEFFAPTTTNERKREIESQLTNFSNQRDCWRFCVYFMRHTASQYVSMYALSTLEVRIVCFLSHWLRISLGFRLW